MIVDTHAHYLPQEMLDDLKNRSSDFPSIECMSDGETWKLGFAVGSLSRPIHPNLRNSDKRLRWMDEQQIDVQVCGGWPDSFGYEIPDAEGMRWSQFINEHLMKNCDASDHLAPLASVPLQNGKMAAKILEEALNHTDDFGRDARSIMRTLENIKDPDQVEKAAKEDVDKIKSFNK